MKSPINIANLLPSLVLFLLAGVLGLFLLALCANVSQSEMNHFRQVAAMSPAAAKEFFFYTKGGDGISIFGAWELSDRLENASFGEAVRKPDCASNEEDSQDMNALMACEQAKFNDYNKVKQSLKGADSFSNLIRSLLIYNLFAFFASLLVLLFLIFRD